MTRQKAKMAGGINRKATVKNPLASNSKENELSRSALGVRNSKRLYKNNPSAMFATRKAANEVAKPCHRE